mmetsp:Transcript_8083/g.20114  ORF Transcript_8083/g.20114 Transcript_8083/m.20114 type:complete len:134 (+) Transcript_8083:57-458(+)
MAQQRQQTQRLGSARRSDGGTPPLTPSVRSMSRASSMPSGLSNMGGAAAGGPGDRQLQGLALANAGAACIYMRSNQEYGHRQPPLSAPKFGLSCRFSDYLAETGLYKFRGLQTRIEKPSRYMDGSTDWCQKNA